MAAAVVITPVKQQQQQLQSQSLAGRLPSRSGSRRKSMKHLLLQTTPEQQQQEHKSAVMNTVHNSLAPALSLPQKKRGRELASNNKQQLNENATLGGALNALDENSDLIRNGRALFAATTTSLAAPLDIPNKRRRIEVVDRVADGATAPAAPAGDLATPKQSSVLLNAVGSKQRLSSRKEDSINKKPASHTTAAARSTFTRETEELRTATDKRTRQEDAVANWSKKYGEAIKGFVFYFDGFEDSKRREAERALRDLGARTESFFSKKVTHVVTTRPVPDKPAEVADQNTANSKPSHSIFRAPAGKENAQPTTQSKRPASESPTKRTTLEEGKQDPLAGPSRRPRTRLGVANANSAVLALRTPPKIKPYADSIDSQDVLVKAKHFNMKIWDVPKLEKVLTRLLTPLSPEKDNRPLKKTGKTYHFNFQAAAAETKPSLPYLLRNEQITGSTYERDLSTARPDYHYFNRLNGYLLVEDISGEYQPAHAKEYTQRVALVDDNTDTHWPTLFGGQEGRGAFFKPSASHAPPLPAMPRMPKVEAAEPVFEIARRGEEAPLLRRAVSLNALRAGQAPRTRAKHSAVNLQSYQIASGNSQIITSNIASGTSTTTTRSGQVIGAGAGNNSLANGIIIDKRLARLGSKAKKHVVTLGRAVQNTADDSKGLLRRSLTAASKPSTAVRAVKEYVPKPGYCENCRVRYDDFKEHTRSKKHRRFALNSANWEDLDRLLAAIPRPVNRELLELYEAAGCECPSDVERSDNEDEEDVDDVEEDDVDQSQEAGVYMEDSGYARHTPEMVTGADAPAERRTRAEHKYFAGPAYDEPEEESDGEPEDEDEEESLGEVDTSEEEDALREDESGSESVEEDERGEMGPHEVIDLVDDGDEESL